MSVKFEKETFRETGNVLPQGYSQGDQRGGFPQGGQQSGFPQGGQQSGFPQGGQQGGFAQGGQQRGFAEGDHHRGFKHEIAHELGEKITGGESTQGYLAVRLSPASLRERGIVSTVRLIIDFPGLPQPIADEPAENKDAHKRHPSRATGGAGILHRP